MKKVLTFSILGLFAFGGSLLVPLAFAADVPGVPPVQQEQAKGQHERHPEIHKAINKLKAAKEDLEKAAHDYAGHRVKAIQAIDQALEELRLALASDKK